MASITPRISGLLANDYFEGAMGEDDVERCELDGRTPLDRTIDRIGMGVCFMAVRRLYDKQLTK